jgi:glycerol kinase
MTVLLAIDQGTTSTRAIAFDAEGNKLGTHQLELAQSFPGDGWVEHDARQIWQDTLSCVRGALKAANCTAADVTALGMTNQRETTVLWNRQSGQPIAPAIVWQDRRTADFCAQHADQSEWLSAKTGLLLDPYFSATKIAWLLDHTPGAREQADRGELAFGTIDSWLLWNLTQGAVHATDATNACRTALFNIHSQDWDDELLDFFKVPRSLMPEVRDSAGDFGHAAAELFGCAIPIRGIAGDQQAALIGQACFSPGMAKSTYGTGCFVVLNTGKTCVQSAHRLLSTVAYRLKGETTYALEGSIFVAGAAVQWLRDALHLIKSAGETEALARSVKGQQGVYLVPAFTGLGAPYWDPQARGAILGLTRDTGLAHIVRAALESVAYQTRDLLDAMAADSLAPTELRVDGGMVINDWLSQFLADALQTRVLRPQVTETTALGAAFLAGLGSGVYPSLEAVSALWSEERRFLPSMPADEATRLHVGWQAAVASVRSHANG